MTTRRIVTRPIAILFLGLFALIGQTLCLAAAPSTIPQLWITDIDVDVIAGTMTIHGENFDNGTWKPTVMVDEVAVTVYDTSTSVTLDCSIPTDTEDYVQIWVRTGDEFERNALFDIYIGDEPTDPTVDFQYRSVHAGGKPLYYEILEDWEVDLAAYFGPGRTLYLPNDLQLEPFRQSLYDRVISMPHETDWAFIELDPGGILTLKQGYRWDGPSLPGVYQKRFAERWIRASCVHDAIYDLCRLGILLTPDPWDSSTWIDRLIADCMIYMLAREDGLKASKAEWGFFFIRIGGGIKIRNSLALPDWKYHALPEIGQVIDAAPPTGAPLLLDATGSRFAQSFRWAIDGTTVVAAANNPLPLITVPAGIHTVSVEVSDVPDDPDPTEGKAEMNFVVFTDAVPPVFDNIEDIVVPTDPGVCYATVHYTITATDDNGFVQVVCDPASGGQFPLGETTVNCTATDLAGNVALASFTVTVEDRELPVLVAAKGPTILRHSPSKFTTFTVDDLILSVSDNCTPLTLDDVTIARITSDEMDGSAPGKGKTAADIAIAHDRRSVELRRKRDGRRNGRVYTIEFAAIDTSGNQGVALHLVHIPHGAKGASIDDGAAYSVE